MKKNELLNFLKESLYCRAKCASVHGVGVFAIKRIPPDIDGFSALGKDYRGSDYHFYSPEELSVLDEGILEMIVDYCVACDSGKYEICESLPRWVQGGCVYLINHSDSPNLRYYADTDDIITTREIEEGEELFLDYNQLCG